MSAISFGEEVLPRALFDERIERAASALASVGIRRGDGIAVMMRNEPAFIEASMAAGSLGAFTVPINWHCVADDLRYILEDSGVSALFIHSDLLEQMRSGISEHIRIFVVETPDLIRKTYRLPPVDASLPAGATPWAPFRDGFPRRRHPPETLPQIVFYTSGTTGRPKGVKRIMGDAEMAIIAGVMARSYGFLGEYGQAGEISTVVTGPMYHGLPNAHSNFTVRAGASVTIMPRFDPEELLRIIETKRITHLNMVPIMFYRLLQLPPEVRGKYDLSSLRYVVHGAAPIAPAIKREMIAWWGPVIHEYYGATEVGNVVFCNSEEWLAHPGTVGKAPPGTDVLIVDRDGNQLPAGEVGEIVCRIQGAGDMTYLNHDEDRRAMELVPGFIGAGDMGYLDEDGFLFICDRVKDMIISGGVNIYPAQIEAALHKMPGVADCAVFGIPDQEFGESVHAVIELKPDAPAVTAATVREYLREQVPGYMSPKTVEFATDLPREESGKLFKRKLREPFWQGMDRRI
ncbi:MULTISPECIES: AMP-binding protein [unclassified Sphingomonas]|uniref:AMP-binding protein n=1 Tax=unclassified Sphingomonas TaxID=196159 RepID=UPI0006FD6907|nr:MULTISPECIES: AMP-binding protein [unclassified Sphingomonas]KQX25647.1 long-chain fatty acid--CoA ligase [Sphingomonas sp. Root1294]KQY66638.1 long-chain fatty acid--CoA ligase [Sphingomonas sp. Root50]KRB90038.1 long-chain fatty acid--CoA ligase [Sphingomonas sp. Root720]